MNNDWGNFLQLLLEALLVAVLPVLMIYLKQWLNMKDKQVEGHLGASRWEAVKDAVREAVSAAEQSGVRDGLEAAGEQKLAWAIISAEAFLSARGLGGLDLDVLRDLVEAEVHRQFNGKKPDYRILPVAKPYIGTNANHVVTEGDTNIAIGYQAGEGL